MSSEIQEAARCRCGTEELGLDHYRALRGVGRCDSPGLCSWQHDNRREEGLPEGEPHVGLAAWEHAREERSGRHEAGKLKAVTQTGS